MWSWTETGASHQMLYIRIKLSQDPITSRLYCVFPGGSQWVLGLNFIDMELINLLYMMAGWI